MLLLLYAAGCAVGCVVCFPAIVAVVMLSMARPGNGSDPVKTYGTVSISTLSKNYDTYEADEKDKRQCTVGAQSIAHLRQN